MILFFELPCLSEVAFKILIKHSQMFPPIHEDNEPLSDALL